MYDEFKEWRDAHEKRIYAASNRNSDGFWGFRLSGNAKLEEVARFYGLKVPDLKPAVTLSAYLGHKRNGSSSTGQRTPVGGADLLILETEDGKVSRVGLEFRLARRHRSSPRGGR
ncbi:MAG TPA: transporter associated domain-containing protein [Burkholderiales bacterium]|nr:transporter associated domain-containing protein [Burkholderiales bacterium]